MKILILGGTGAMGAPLTDLLSETEHVVYITSRKEHQPKKNISYICGNAKDISFLSELLKNNYDCIIDFMSYSTDEFKDRVNLFLDSCAQYIFISSARVYANSNKLLTEDSPRLLDVCIDKTYLSTDEYALAKARQENLLFENEHKNWTIVRPGTTYNSNRLQLGVFEKDEWLYTALNKNKIYFSEDIAPHYATLTFGKDVAKGIFALIGQESALGEKYHITVGQSLKWSEVLDIYKKTLEDLGYPVEVVMEKECYRLKNEAYKYQVIYGRYFDRKYDNSKINAFIDINDFIKPEEGLVLCLKEAIKKKDFFFPYISYPIIHAMQEYDIKIPMNKIGTNKQRIKYILSKMKLLK